MSEQLRRIFTATLVLGVTGSGKTSLSATLAEYLWEVYKKILLLYSSDGGAFSTIVQKRVQQGLIRVWRMRTRSGQGLAFETCYLASKGYWPKTINPETGEVTPAVELVAPVTATYTISCPAGHSLGSVPSINLVKPSMCAPCQKLYSVPELNVLEHAKQAKGFEQVGGCYFDGLTSMSQWFMGELDERAGRGELGGEKSALGGILTSGDLKFGGNSRAHYGFAQTRIQQIVNNALSIPNLVEGPVFTALSHEVEEGGQLPVVGPKLAGSAKTDEAPQWFGNVFEAAELKDDKGLSFRRLYLQPFTDHENRRHLLKNSSTGSLPSFLDDPALGTGKMFSQFNLGLVYRLLDQDLVKALEEKVEGAPGLPAGLMSYGEPLRVEPPPTPPTPAAPTAPSVPSVPSMAKGPSVPSVVPTAPTVSRAPSVAPPPGKPPMKAPTA